MFKMLWHITMTHYERSFFQIKLSTNEYVKDFLVPYPEAVRLTHISCRIRWQTSCLQVYKYYFLLSNAISLK